MKDTSLTEVIFNLTTDAFLLLLLRKMHTFFNNTSPQSTGLGTQDGHACVTKLSLLLKVPRTILHNRANNHYQGAAYNELS